jgi:hypothetical protein
MSPDLVAIGDQLEDAARRVLARRRARRQTVLNAAATFIIALPIALAAATADLDRAEPAGVGASTARPVLQWTPEYRVAGSHLPRRGPRIIATVRCPERSECPAPLPVPPTLKRASR